MFNDYQDSRVDCDAQLLLVGALGHKFRGEGQAVLSPHVLPVHDVRPFRVYYLNDRYLSDSLIYNRIIPMLIMIPCLGNIIKASSTITAVSELDFQVIGTLLRPDALRILPLAD